MYYSYFVQNQETQKSESESDNGRLDIIELEGGTYS